MLLFPLSNSSCVISLDVVLMALSAEHCLGLSHVPCSQCYLLLLWGKPLLHVSMIRCSLLTSGPNPALTLWEQMCQIYICMGRNQNFRLFRKVHWYNFFFFPTKEKAILIKIMLKSYAFKVETMMPKIFKARKLFRVFLRLNHLNIFELHKFSTNISLYNAL